MLRGVDRRSEPGGEHQPVVLPLVTATDLPVAATGVSRRPGDAGARHRNHSVRGRCPDGSSRVSRPRYASPSDRLERAARMPTAIGSNSDSTRRRGAAEEVAAGLAGNGARTKVRAGECRRCLLHVVYATGTAPGGKRWVASSPARSGPSARRAASAAGRLHRARPRARKG